MIKIAQLRAGDTAGSDRASARLDPDYIVQDGDVLFSWSGSLECVVWTGGPGALNQHLFRVTSGCVPKWVYYLWIHEHLPSFRRIAASKATTMGHIQRHHLSEALTVIPDEPMVQAADRVFAPIVDALVGNAIESGRLTIIRDSLLPRLLAGPSLKASTPPGDSQPDGEVS
ncbi:MAG: hypothetical protein IPK07_30700 [Deltaproteobacteria bacterium]|nr:hypothetical protein [Deltaproteobacteria bacterium]